jgi:hypothetical protein
MKDDNPKHISSFNAGADMDSEPEMVFSEAGNGIFADSHNARPVSNDGNTGSNEKIKGEQLLYPNNKSLTNYKCTGSVSVNNKKVEFWAPNSGVGPGICVVDGVVCLNSIDFDLKPDFPLQMDKSDAANDSLVFITDNRVPPYIFDVNDMLDALLTDPDKYFSAFNPLLYQVNIQSPLDRIAFIELINVGGGGGLPVGQYLYEMRYVTEEGDRTNWSPATPLIPVMQSLSSESRIYPWVKTYGGPYNPQSKTSYAPRLRFRVTNIYNYDYIEIKRKEYNQGAGIEYSPPGKIVAKIPISPGEISVREYIDPAESNTDIVLSPNDETQQLVEIERAKGIRYFDRRTELMNVKLASRDASPDFLEINEQQGFPVIDKLFKAGYNDPYNHVYRRKYMNGEVYGFGAVLYDGVGTRNFVTKADKLKAFQFPNRRETISADTANYSFFGTVKAANNLVNDTVTQTHEVFDLGDPVFKSDECGFKNIVREGKVLGLTGSRTVTKVKEDCDEDEGEIENHGANVNVTQVTVSHQPFTPVRQSDPDVTGHEYVVDTKVYTDGNIATCVADDEDRYNFRPSGFSPDYYAQGLMVAGLTNFPKWAKAFSVVRTEAAKRVVCQGLGFYTMTQAKYKIVGNAELGGKEQNKVWFFSPDIEQGIVSSDTLNDIVENPQNYKIQMVSPLGFFSEDYSFEDNALVCSRDRLHDMVTYVRMLRDNDSDPNNQINPGEDPSMGVPGGDGFNYIAYDKFRNVTQNPNTFGSHVDKGERLFDLAAVRRKAEGRGKFIEIETIDNIYGKASTGGVSDRHFDNGGMKDWTEPMYVINIIRTGATIRDQNIQKYRSTDHYQKLESVIGKSNGLPQQKYQLVDERWEDCIPALSASMFGAGTNRFIYIKKRNGTYQKWVNVTYMTSAQRSLIEATIIGSGFYTLGPDDIYGVYKHTNTANRFFEIDLYHTTIAPADGDLVIVKYDNTAPIRVYGGDTYVGEAIFAPVDREADAKEKAAETQFAWGIGFPYFKWKLNPRYYTIRKAGALLNVVQDELQTQLGYFRQLCAMFTCECRAGIHLSYNAEYPNQFFPLINYVIRPNRWDEDKSISDNGIHQDYEDDYGVDEKTQWKWGGLRFLQQINPDYSCESPLQFTSKPIVGFVEKTEFPTGSVWSLQRAINVQDSPGLRTFAANSFFPIDDDTGEIKRAYSATTGKGENLYAITDRGVCLLITKKSILSDMNAGELGYMSADAFVQGQYWLSRDTGMNDEFWRSAVEAFIPIVKENDEEERIESLIFANQESVFMLVENSVVDIGRVKYYNKLFNQGLSKVTTGFTTHMTAAYNKSHHEYWLHLKNEEIDITFVYGAKIRRWHGTNDFKFDSFTSVGTQIFGHRDLETYELNKGYIVNSGPVTYKLLVGAAPEAAIGKEFVEVKINSTDGVKPTSILFRKKIDGPIVCSLTPSLSSQGALYVKDYNGYKGQIPRMDVLVSPVRDRLQGRVVFYEIIHNLASEFKVIDSILEYKPLRLK